MIATLNQLAGTEGRLPLDATTATMLATVLILLLVVLIIEREIYRFLSGPPARLGVRALWSAILPLLVAFSVIVVIRFSDLLRF
jgi:hypothetical protein